MHFKPFMFLQKLMFSGSVASQMCWMHPVPHITLHRILLQGRKFNAITFKAIKCKDFVVKVGNKTWLYCRKWIRKSLQFNVFGARNWSWFFCFHLFNQSGDISRNNFPRGLRSKIYLCKDVMGRQQNFIFHDENLVRVQSIKCCCKNLFSLKLQDTPPACLVNTKRERKK